MYYTVKYYIEIVIFIPDTFVSISMQEQRIDIYNGTYYVIGCEGFKRCHERKLSAHPQV
jgi:hypothetical protein